MKKPKLKPLVIDLFCGCGGFSYGLRMANFDIALGIDSWGASLKTFSCNHPEAKILEADISKINGKDIKKLVGEKNVDVVVGGPPCQGFSLSGLRNFYDARNGLYLDFIRLVKELSPHAFVIENVPGLAGLFGGRVKERIIHEFGKLGYSVNSQILNASDYGVPQHRRRIVFVGLKGKRVFEFPKLTHLDKGGKKKITVEEAISDLPALSGETGAEELAYRKSPQSDYQKRMRRGSGKIFNHTASNHAEKTVKIISLVPEGGNYKSLPAHLKNTRNFHVAWTRLHNKKPSPTIDTGHRHHFHPTENRVPTVREAARIQSFPDTFRFFGPKTAQYKQVGNAVPPLLAAALGEKLLKYL